MHSFFSKFDAGDTVCLTVDVTAGYELDERELGMVVAVTFTGMGALYSVAWSDRTEGNHIEQELTLIVGQTEEAGELES